MEAVFFICLSPMRSTVTGDSKIRSGVLEAEITTSSRKFPSLRTKFKTWLFVVTSIVTDSNPTLLA